MTSRWRCVHMRRLLSVPTKRHFCVFCVWKLFVLVALSHLKAHLLLRASARHRQNFIQGHKYSSHGKARWLWSALEACSTPDPHQASSPQWRHHGRLRRGVCAEVSSITLANVRLLDNKLTRSTKSGHLPTLWVSECCVFVETWRMLLGRQSARGGRKTHGGGLCVYINDACCCWFVNTAHHQGSWWLLSVLPVEGIYCCFASSYIHSSQLHQQQEWGTERIHQLISEQQTTHPAIFLILTDGARCNNLTQGITRDTGSQVQRKNETSGNMNVFFIYTTTKW